MNCSARLPTIVTSPVAVKLAPAIDEKKPAVAMLVAPGDRAPNPPKVIDPLAVRSKVASLNRIRSRLRLSVTNEPAEVVPAAPTDAPTVVTAAPEAISNCPPFRLRPASSRRSPLPSATSVRTPSTEPVTRLLSSAMVRSETSRPARIVTSPPPKAPTPEVK